MSIVKENLFEARTFGYWTYRIPGLAVSKNDTVLATVEARPGRGGDYDFNDILMRRSTDGGLHFEDPQVLVNHAAYGDGPASNCVMFADPKSPHVHVVFCHDYARMFYMHSRDAGANFSEPVEITGVVEGFKPDYPWRVIATGPGHGLTLKNGRMLIPVWMSDGSGHEMGPTHRGHRPSVVSSIFSDDQGHSWQTGEIVVRHGTQVNDTTVVNPSETIAVQLKDGSVYFNMRNESAAERRLIARSPDGATDWTVLGFDDALLEPVCMASLIRRDHAILFANPDNLENELITPGHNLSHDRKRLTLKVSNDEAQTWKKALVIEEGPSGYSDLAVLSDGTLLCLYECGIVERMCDDRYATLARIPAEYLR